MNRYMKRITFVLISFVAFSLLPGCMGYRLGNGLPEGIETVALDPVINRSGEPAIELEVARALREAIQFDGRLKLVDEPARADGIIAVTLTAYDLVPIAFQDENHTTPQLYRLRITGMAALRKVDAEEAVSTSETYGEAIFPFQSDLTSAKRDALPSAAAEIARYMIDDLIEPW